MRFTSSLLLATSIAFLAGCADSNHAYLKGDQQTKPLQMPAGTNLRDEQNYYPLPNAAKNNASTPASTSLVPPGSNLQRFDEKAPAHTSADNVKVSSRAKWEKGNTGEPILVLLEKKSQAWEDVGKALGATDYQVLDRDSSMSSYYILDTEATDNQITEKTPIYRVYVEADKDTAKISLMSEKNKAVNANVAKKILSLLEKHLA